MTEYIQVVTSVEREEDALKIAERLVSMRLVACTQISGPIKSYFWWKEKIDNAIEYLIIMKSRSDLFSELESVIKEIHPYDVPEILATPVLAGGRDYLNWLERELRK